jgi:hypothetical protein
MWWISHEQPSQTQPTKLKDKQVSFSAWWRISMQYHRGEIKKLHRDELIMSGREDINLTNISLTAYPILAGCSEWPRDPACWAVTWLRLCSSGWPTYIRFKINKLILGILHRLAEIMKGSILVASINFMKSSVQVTPSLEYTWRFRYGYALWMHP